MVCCAREQNKKIINNINVLINRALTIVYWKKKSALNVWSWDLVHEKTSQLSSHTPLAYLLTFYPGLILKCIHWKKYDDSVRKLKIENKYFDVESLYLYKFCLFMFKFKNNLLPASFKDYCKNVKCIHNYHTRSSETNYFLPRFNNKSGQKFLAYQGSKL